MEEKKKKHHPGLVFEMLRASPHGLQTESHRRFAIVSSKPRKKTPRRETRAGKRFALLDLLFNQFIASFINSPSFAARLSEQRGAQRRQIRSNSSRGSCYGRRVRCNGTTGEHREPREHSVRESFQLFLVLKNFLKRRPSFFLFFLSLFAGLNQSKHRPW